MPASLTLHVDVMSIEKKEIKKEKEIDKICTYKVYPIYSSKDLVNPTGLQKQKDKAGTPEGQGAVSFPADFSGFQQDVRGKQFNSISGCSYNESRLNRTHNLTFLPSESCSQENKSK